MRLFGRFRHKDESTLVPATRLLDHANGSNAAPADASCPAWFTDGSTVVFEVPEQYNKANGIRLYGYIDGTGGAAGKHRQKDYFEQVRSAVEYISGPAFKKLEPAQRMGVVCNTLEASLEAAKWDVNGDLTSGVGNVATDTTQTGWWEETKPLLARVIVHQYQDECRQRMAA